MIQFQNHAKTAGFWQLIMVCYRKRRAFMVQDTEPQFIEVGSGAEARRIAVRYRDGNAPILVWLGGYRSDMLGTKAEAINQWAAGRQLANLRHDYSGHGESGGEFRGGTISRWLEESLAVFDRFADGRPAILIGSSMGAWIALKMAQKLHSQGRSTELQGLLLLAPAPDFTAELMMPELSDEHRRQLETQGYMEEPSEYSDEPNIFTKALFDDGEKNRVMTGPIQTGCPVHILQGMQDSDVPYTHALKLTEFLPIDNVTMTLIRDGDHRLSRDQDIQLILESLERMAAMPGG
jgi:pimeloyl-ACP methyl ester carboxylesterase